MFNNVFFQETSRKILQWTTSPTLRAAAHLKTRGWAAWEGWAGWAGWAAWARGAAACPSPGHQFFHCATICGGRPPATSPPRRADSTSGRAWPPSARGSARPSCPSCCPSCSRRCCLISQVKMVNNSVNQPIYHD